MNTSKIIKGAVSNGRYTVTAPIVKEDYGLYLQIEGVELPSTYQVDFSNSENSGTSVTMIGNSEGVLIPHQFIETGKDVFAFLYHVGADYGRTVYKFRIPNKFRPDRTEETPTPEEQSVIDQAISALNEAVAQTAQDVESADQSAQSAQGYAEQAEQARDTAQTYANNAQTSATSAQTSASQASASATASAQSASQSAQIKADVEELADDAQGYANSASQSASQASASEQGCARAVSDATSAAAIARARADEASGYAQTASEKASEASASATTASNKATEASGYATASQTAQGLAESARDSAISAKTDAEQAKADAETARDEAQTIVDGISGALDDKADIITDTASGSIASFTDGADDLPLKSLVVDINPVQDLSHGDPSPENICPISGWTGVEVSHSGGNLWNPEPNGMALWAPSVGTQIPSMTIDFSNFDDDVLTIDSTWGWNGNAFITPKLPTGRTYKVTGVIDSSNNKPRVAIYTLDANRRMVRSVQYVVQNGSIDVTVTMGAQDARICVSVSNGEDRTPTTITNPCISETGVYEPYTGRSIAIDLGQTVYGGHLDVLSGELVVYPYYASYNGETLTGEWISDRDKYVSGTTPTIGAQVVNIGAQGVTVQLEPHEVASLYGVNNIWADSGDTEVVYRADTKLYIAKKIAEAISALS